jgi:hypothetical protein
MRKMILVLGCVSVMSACGDSPSPVAPSGASDGGTTTSCNGNPPGQQPSGNPANAPGNSSSLDNDCKTKVTQETVVWGT